MLDEWTDRRWRDDLPNPPSAVFFRSSSCGLANASRSLTLTPALSILASAANCERAHPDRCPFGSNCRWCTRPSELVPKIRVPIGRCLATDQSGGGARWLEILFHPSLLSMRLRHWIALGARARLLGTLQGRKQRRFKSPVWGRIVVDEDPLRDLLIGGPPFFRPGGRRS